MNNFRLTCILLLIGFVRASLSQGAEPETSILDQVKSSSVTRKKIIAQYESSTNGFIDDKLLAVAISYAMETNYDKAKPVYVRFLNDHPDHPRALRGLGSLYGIDGNFDEAIKCLNKSWSLGDGPSLQPLALMYVRTKKYDEVERLLPALIARKREDSGVVLCLIEYALTKDPPNEALILAAIDGLPDKDFMSRPDIAQLVASACSRLRAIDKDNNTLQAIAEKIIRGYLEDPSHWPKDLLCSVGDAYRLTGQFVKAEALYKQALEIHPEWTDALAGLGGVYAFQSKWKESIASYRKAWSLGDSRVLHDLAGISLGAGDLDGMKDLIQPLLEHKGEDLENVNILVMYSLAKKPKDKELFYKAIDGLSDQQILRRDDISNVIVNALNIFGDNDRALHLLELKAKQKK